jgi:hypothetical protein
MEKVCITGHVRNGMGFPTRLSGLFTGHSSAADWGKEILVAENGRNLSP